VSENGQKHVRLAVRCLALIAAAAVALSVLPWAFALPAPAAVSPFVAACSAIAARSVSLVTLIGLPVLAVSWFRRRWFCRWACPVGLLLEQVGRLRRSPGDGWKKLPPLGRWIALVTLAGACFGYPLLLWLDPLAMFGGLFGAFRWPLTVVSVLAAGALPIVVVGTLLLPRVWCGRLCPLGGTQELLASIGRTRRRAPRGQVGQAAPPAPAPAPLSRRSVLALGVGAAWGAVTVTAFGRGRRQALRPPGAVDEARFTGLCIRCGQCVRACPSEIIHPDLGRFGVASFLTPVIRYEGNYCLADCRRCTQVCPSGALRRLSPADKRRAHIGLARVDRNLCLAGVGAKCAACVDSCPYEAIRIVTNKEYYAARLEIDPRKCNGCGACQAICVTAPRKAIVVGPRE